MDAPVLVPLLAALVGLVGVTLAALVSRRHDRDQQARQMMLDPSGAFARSTLAALAQLRYVTPPDTLESRPHRNDVLLSDMELRTKRLVECEGAIDQVREARAGVTLVFHPKSWPAEHAKMIGAVLRECFELVESFYDLADQAAARGRADEWRGTELQELRLKYMTKRRDVRKFLNAFYDAVALRMVRPSWGPPNPEADLDQLLRSSDVKSCD